MRVADIGGSATRAQRSMQREGDEIVLASPSLPAVVRSDRDVAAWDAAARRVALPCADGEMVWRTWGAGEPVVLLHGGAGSWTHWVRNIGALVAARRSVWLPDLPGFGESAAVAGARDADALPGPVEAALHDVVGDAACDLVGFSFGAMVATLIAAQHPVRVRRLVLVGAPALGIPPVEPLHLRSPRRLESKAERDAAHRHNLDVLMLHEAASIDDLSVALQAANADRDRMKRRRLSRTDLLLRALPDVRCPIFGIWGEHDALYRSRTALIEPALRAAAGDFRWLRFIERAGHWVQFERSDAFDLALAEALG